jgi:uncharacterized membrane protein
MPKADVASLLRSLSPLGLVLGALFFAASLTPSLIPRAFLLQGMLGGVCFALGYGVGVASGALWRYLELPLPGGRTRRVATWTAAAVAAVIAIGFLSRAAEWQNSIRERMGMAPVDTAHPLEVAAIAIVVFLVLYLLARLFGMLFRMAQVRVRRFVPERVSWVIGIGFAVLVFVLLIDGILIRAFLRASDYSFRTLDALIEPDVAPPSDPNATGGPDSLIAWEKLGRAGREFVATGPTGEDIAAFLGREAMTSLRVYVGLNSAEDVESRAELALREMIRAGAFEREVLVVVVPTGTGWMDPEAMDTLEYLHAGDTAIVAMQYSYLTSWISLLVEPGFGVEAGRALFREVYGYWSKLPRDERPRLYLHGLSLGAFSSEQSVRLHEILSDPIHGAVWSGPPFSSPIWRAATEDREPGSPAWLPRFGDGSVVRFSNQKNALDIPGAEWGPLRIVYLQYASDPITFFRPDSLYRRPAWMDEPRGPDVSPELRWYPGVTFLQLLLDMAIGLVVPMGYGHLFAPEHYIDAWEAVTEPEGWTPEEIDRLKAHFAQ